MAGDLSRRAGQRRAADIGYCQRTDIGWLRGGRRRSPGAQHAAGASGHHCAASRHCAGCCHCSAYHSCSACHCRRWRGWRHVYRIPGHLQPRRLERAFRALRRSGRLGGCAGGRCAGVGCRRHSHRLGRQRPQASTVGAQYLYGRGAGRRHAGHGAVRMGRPQQRPAGHARPGAGKRRAQPAGRHGVATAGLPARRARAGGQPVSPPRQRAGRCRQQHARLCRRGAGRGAGRRVCRLLCAQQGAPARDLSRRQ